MNLQSLISELRTQQIKIWIDGEKLRYRTADGKLPSELRENIRQYRQELIEFLQQEKSEPDYSRVIPAVDRDSAMPLSYAEERLWFISSLSHDQPVFQNHNAYRIAGNLDVELLNNSLAQLVARHEILRTRYVLLDSVLCRQVDDPGSFKLARRHVRPNAGSSIEGELHLMLTSEQNRKMDLKTEGGFQAMMIQLPDNEHILIFKFHHIIYDDQTMSMLWRELNRNYHDGVHARPLDQSELPLQYADFACWQRSASVAGVERGLSFWKDKLTDVPQAITLPTDFVRPLNQRYSGDRLVRSISGRNGAGLDQLCKKYRATRYMVLLALFSFLLHRYSGQSTVLVGSPVSNRRSNELESMLGCFLDTIVLRTDFDSGLTFSDLLAKVRDTTLEAFEHQQVPFEKIVEQLKPDRNAGIHPVFQVMFNFLQDRKSETGLAIDGLEIEQLRRSSEISADYDLNLTVVERQDQLNYSLVYNRDLFKATTIARMADHFENLLDEVIRNPEAVLSEYSMLSVDERRLMLYDWNSTNVEYPSHISLCEMFEQQVRATPTRAALLYGDTTVSYSALNDHANQLAHHLLSIGVEEQSVVGVHLERSPQVTVALLAILKINAVYLPLDSEYPAIRLHRMLESGNARCLITIEALSQSIAVKLLRRVLLDKDQDVLAKSPTTNLAVNCAADDLAYIVFTSGSTGVPKGVKVPHRQILNRLHWMWRHYPFTAQDTSCQKTAISFVDSLWELLGPLLRGSPSVILPAQSLKDPALLLQQLVSYKVSRLWLVPTLLHLLLGTSKARGVALPDLKFVVVSGEPLPAPVAQDVLNHWPGVSLFNLYGTSEAWDSSWHEVVEVDTALSSVPIGKPIDNTQLHILDDQLNPVPVGVIGQLYIGGDGLAGSFMESSSINGTGFVQKPWDRSLRMYGSGDHACYLPDGTICLTGREFGHFNVRGYRVDPAEIENAMGEFSGVSRAAVLQRTTPSGVALLVAFVQRAPDEDTSSDRILEVSLRHHLKARVPAYMIPSAFVFSGDFPRTPSGKTDRLALQALEWELSEETLPADDAPRSALETDIQNIWQSVLNKQAVGIHENFFDLGGHSLMAVELFDKLSRIAGSSLQLTMLFDASTIALQAEVIQNLTTGRTQSSLVAIQPNGTKAPLFLVPPAAGTGLNYRRLARYLGEEQPVYTFNLATCEPGDAKSESMEMMAKRLIKEMRHLQPQGPYVIGGMCFGGVVAWEMARQLHQSSQSLVCVVMLDSSMPFHGPEWSNIYRKPSLRTIVHRNFLELAENRFSRESSRRFYRRTVRKLLRPWTDRLQQFRELRDRHGRLLRHYKASRHDVDVLMICSNTFAERAMYMDRWRSLIGGNLELEILSEATHTELLIDSNVFMQTISEKIDRYLDEKLNADN